MKYYGAITRHKRCGYITAEPVVECERTSKPDDREIYGESYTRLRWFDTREAAEDCVAGNVTMSGGPMPELKGRKSGQLRGWAAERSRFCSRETLCNKSEDQEDLWSEM
ncbi:hypothetical protein FACS1894208_00280 [Clostridia bacterium]|nr:hypothetical protein FACS1894208_00280 [Clostridia bacterium]